MLRSRLADVRIANQLTRDVFVEVWRTAKRFDPARHHVVTWILSIAVELLNRHLQPSSPTGVVAQARPSAQRATERALLSLPAMQQRALVLTRLHGLTPAQAADRMGLSTLDVETRITAGLDLITAQLAIAR